MAEPTLNLLRADVWPTLKQRLDEAALQSSSAAASDVVARPIELLALMAADALPALGEDALAAERLRMLLYLAAPFQTLVDEARTLEVAARDGEAGYEPGVLDHGGLALLGLAAIRVAPAAGHDAFVRTVHGLALSAAPAEVLGRLVPRLPEGDGLAVILDTLYLLDTVGAALKTPLLRPFASDPAERARWRCLGRLFDDDLPGALAAARRKLKLPESTPLQWDGASSALIDDVQPQEPPPERRAKVSVRGGKPGEGVRVVFAAAGQPPLGARLLELEPAGKGAQLTVEVPHGAQAGWVGLSEDKLIEASNELRAALRETLPAALQRRGCLRSSEVPATLVPSIGVPDHARPGKLIATPPRTASARWAGPPLDERASSMAHARSIARESHARTALSGAPRLLALHVAQAGRQKPLFAGQPLDVEVLLDGPAAPGEVQLQLDPPHPGVQLAPGTAGAAQRLRFSVPAAAVEDGLLITARMASPGSAALSAGPLSLKQRRPLRIVLALPQIIEPALPPVDRALFDRFLVYVAAQRGLEVTAVDLPWLDDELSLLAAPLASGDDARVPGLFEALSRRAMLTPHLEDALWLLLVPEPPVARAGDSDEHVFKLASSPALLQRALAAGRGFFRLATAEAARGVAVADPLGLPALFDALLPLEAAAPAKAAPTPRLRLLGTLSPDEVRIESAQEELRAAGAGAPLESGLSAVGLDRRGRELIVQPLMCLSHARPAQLAALLPVSPEVTAVEIRLGLRRLYRVDRVRGEGSVDEAQLVKGPVGEPLPLAWRFTHSMNARPALALSLGWERLATEVQQIDCCERPARLHLARYRGAQGLTLSACDGWSTSARSIDDAAGKPFAYENPTPVVLRRLPDGRYFADAPDFLRIEWAIDGAPLDSSARLIRLPPTARGTLQLLAYGDAKLSPLIDERAIEGTAE